MKIVFFGTSNVALPVLESLSRTHEVIAVVTQPDAKAGRKQEFTESPVSVLAAEMNLPLYKPERIKGNGEFEQQLRDLKPDIFVVVSYGKILPGSLIDLPPFKTVNVHFSLLPRYRGAAPIQYALLNGDSKTGVSIFVLDEQVDHGPLLYQQEFPIDDDDNYITLSEKLAQASGRVISQVLEDYQSGKIVPKEQDHSQATPASIITKQDGQVNWQQNSSEIYNRFRAFYPWPGIWTIWQGKMLKITECSPMCLEEPAAPGTVLEGGAVACGDGNGIKISRLQLEGKNEVSLDEFLNGRPQFIGSVLG